MFQETDSTEQHQEQKLREQEAEPQVVGQRERAGGGGEGGGGEGGEGGEGWKPERLGGKAVALQT